MFYYPEIYKRIYSWLEPPWRIICHPCLPTCPDFNQEYFFIYKMQEIKPFNIEILLEYSSNTLNALWKLHRRWFAMTSRISWAISTNSSNTPYQGKSQVSDYINNVLSDIRIRVSILMYLLSDSQQNPWEIVHESYTNAEPVALR